MEQTDRTKRIDRDDIDKAIVKLCEQYPGRFDVLPYMEFREDDDYWGNIAYSQVEKVAIYNPMYLSLDTLPACLAFIALVVSGPYIAVTESLSSDRERHFYNCAVHVYVLRQLRSIGDFALPSNAVIDFGLEDKGQSVDELFEELKAMPTEDNTLYDSDGNIIIDNNDEWMEYDDE